MRVLRTTGLPTMISGSRTIRSPGVCFCVRSSRFIIVYCSKHIIPPDAEVVLSEAFARSMVLLSPRPALNLFQAASNEGLQYLSGQAHRLSLAKQAGNASLKHVRW